MEKYKSIDKGTEYEIYSKTGENNSQDEFIQRPESFIFDYDKDHDILFVHLKNRVTKECIEVLNGKLILDFDNKNQIVGFELFDVMKMIRQSEGRK